MGQEGVVLVHITSNRGVELDKVKVEVIEITTTKFFEGYEEFSWTYRFLSVVYKWFLKITKPLTQLLVNYLLTLMRNV